MNIQPKQQEKYTTYLDTALLLFDRLNTTIERYDGTHSIREGNFPEYQIQTLYTKHPLMMDDVRELLCDEFEKLHVSIENVQKTIGDTVFNSIAEARFIAEYSAKLTQLKSFVTINHHQYFHGRQLDSCADDSAYFDIEQETANLEKNIVKIDIIYEGLAPSAGNKFSLN